MVCCSSCDIILLTLIRHLGHFFIFEGVCFAKMAELVCLLAARQVLCMRDNGFPTDEIDLFLATRGGGGGFVVDD